MSETLARESTVRLRSESYPGLSLRDLVTALFYYKRAVLLALVIPSVLGVLAGLAAHTSYTAQAQLLVLYGSDYVFHPGNRDTGNDITLDRNQIIQGELQILTSPALAAEVLQAVGPEVVYPGLPESESALRSAVTRFSSDLYATSIPQSNVISLSLRNADRAVAIRVLNEVIAHYITFRSGIFDKGPAQGVNNQRAQFADRLQKAEADLAQFGVEHGISNLDEQISLQLRQRTDNANELATTAQAIGEASARAESLHKQLATVSPTVQMFAESSRSQTVTTLSDSLAKLQVQRRDLLARYQDDFPLVRDIDRQIAGVRAQMTAEPSREGNVTRMGRNTVYDDLKREEIAATAQMQGLLAKKAELEANAARLQARSDELTALSRHYRDLQRTRDVLDQSYRSIARSSEETQLSDALERAGGANVRIVQPADAPLAGHNQRSILFGGGIVLGIVAAIAVFALLNATRQIFINVHDVERQLDIPVLLAVPFAAARRGTQRAPQTGSRRAVERPSFGV